MNVSPFSIVLLLSSDLFITFNELLSILNQQKYLISGINYSEKILTKKYSNKFLCVNNRNILVFNTYMFFSYLSFKNNNLFRAVYSLKNGVSMIKFRSFYFILKICSYIYFKAISSIGIWIYGNKTGRS